jgi:hypothetical protein
MLLTAGVVLLLAGSLAGCTKIPFMPRRDIDTFHADIPLAAETMEVGGVIYVQVINPGAGTDENQPPTLWIPLDEFHRGNYQLPTAVDAPVQTESAAVPETITAPKATGMEDAAATASLPALTGPAEESLEQTSAPPETPIPPSRRAVVLPGSVTAHYPAIVSQLVIEMETKLPLKVLPPGLIPTAIDAWRRNDIEEQRHAARTWLASIAGPPPVQFIILLSIEQTSWDRRLRVVFIDAQTARPAASFSSRLTSRAGGHPLRLLPPAPTPLITLIKDAPWWCQVYQADNGVCLGAGRRSGLKIGQRLELHLPGRHIPDPEHPGEVLGYAFGEPFAEIVVTDWFGADGAIGTVLPPGTEIPAAGCYALLTPEAAAPPAADAAPGTLPPPDHSPVEPRS